MIVFGLFHENVSDPVVHRNGSIVWSSDGTHWSAPVIALGNFTAWYNWEDSPFLLGMDQYQTTLHHLPYATPICYRLLIDGVEMATFQFTTAPAADDERPFNFVAFGDFGIGVEEKPWYVYVCVSVIVCVCVCVLSAASVRGSRLVYDLAIVRMRLDSPQYKVVLAMRTKLNHSAFIMALGDDAYFSGKPHEQHQRTFNYYYQEWSTKPLFITPGNHDYVTNLAAPYLRAFPQHGAVSNPTSLFDQGRYWSTEWGALVHITSLDTEWTQYESANASMVEWLEADLSSQAAQDKPWRIVFMHKMPWTDGSLADADVVSYLIPLFEKYDVQLVLGGHWVCV